MSYVLTTALLVTLSIAPEITSPIVLQTAGQAAGAFRSLHSIPNRVNSASTGP